MFLECSEITFRYPTGSTDVFHRLSLRVKTPGFHALFGPSGVGKTSLARIIVGDITDYSGVVRSDGMKHLLYTYNMERLPDWSSVGKHLEKITPPSLMERKNELIASFEMTQTMKLRFSQLSLGQQNRVNLIRYLLQDFHLLIMDESLANVDERTREKIILRLKDMFPETCFLYISHNVIEVSKFCREILVYSNPSEQKGYSLIRGRDYRTGYSLDRKDLDSTLLEIMNAF